MSDRDRAHQYIADWPALLRHLETSETDMARLDDAAFKGLVVRASKWLCQNGEPEDAYAMCDSLGVAAAAGWFDDGDSRDDNRPRRPS